MSTEISPLTFHDEAFDEGRILVVLNPVATSVAIESATPSDIAYMDRQAGALMRAFHGRLINIETDEKPEVTRESLLDNLRPGDIIVPWGGDGTVNWIGNFLLHDPELSDALRATPILPIMAGNANLGASELTPRHRGRKPDVLDIINHGQIIDTWGSSLTVTSDHPSSVDPEVLSALFCHSVHIGGMVGNGLNAVRGHEARSRAVGRARVDGMAILKAIKATDPIQMDINGQELESVGHIGLNGSRYLRFLSTPASVADMGRYELTITGKTVRYLGSSLTKNMVGKLPWERKEPGEETVYRLTAQPGQQLLLDTDAEPRELPFDEGEETHIKVVVRQQDMPLRMFTNNPTLLLPSEASL